MAFAMIAAVTHFFFHKHRRVTKRVMLHSSTVLMALDFVAAVGISVGSEKLVHACGATGAMLGAFACYLE